MGKMDPELAERVARLEGKVDVMLKINIGELLALVVTMAKVLIG